MLLYGKLSADAVNVSL